jgi:predicted nucleic acid-binding protein
MSLFVDTSVWSLALRRDRVPDVPHVKLLGEALMGQAPVFTAGIIFQEILQGLAGPKQARAIIDRLSGLEMLEPERTDYIGAAELARHCRRNGVQLKTIDALIAHLCIRHKLSLLTTDLDFYHAAKHVPLRLAMSSAA